MTDRDSVRQLMVSKKADLTSALDDAMADFGDGEPDAAGLVIDEKPKKMVKRPLKIRLSMSSQNSDSGVSCLPLAEEHPGMEAVNSPSTRDAIAGGLFYLTSVKRNTVNPNHLMSNAISLRNALDIPNGKAAAEACSESLVEEALPCCNVPEQGGEDQQGSPRRGLHLSHIR